MKKMRFNLQKVDMKRIKKHFVLIYLLTYMVHEKVQARNKVSTKVDYKVSTKKGCQYTKEIKQDETCLMDSKEITCFYEDALKKRK